MLFAALLLAAIGGDLLDSLGRSLLGWCFCHGWKWVEMLFDELDEVIL